MTVDEKLDHALQRLELIESHLLDILLPKRQAFMRQPQTAPPPVLSEKISSLSASVAEVKQQFDTLSKQVLAAVNTPVPEDKKIKEDW